ncbi:MAG: RNA-directed DNA polymerase [Proteobacteria bacterium]|nr:RNA-directed DNA polymerase [Pseudomonadota bacterium]MBU0967113.1 RNA-directed DNA polymerase [Pseudomonadota bacterium]
MRHDILWEKVQRILSGRNYDYGGVSRELVDYLLHQVIYTHATENCTIKCSKAEWQGLPKSKSLFYTERGCGLPIGNLTSQLFGNIFLNDFDQFVKHKLRVQYYGRYVDDMVFIHHSRDYLLEVIGKVREELSAIGLEVHPGKIYLQHYTKGVLFLGQFIKPFRKYISQRTKGNFFKMIDEINTLLDTDKRITDDVIGHIQSRMNSFLGILGQADTFDLINKARKRLCAQFYFFFLFNKSFSKVTPNLRNLLWHYTQPCLSIKSLMTC